MDHFVACCKQVYSLISANLLLHELQEQFSLAVNLFDFSDYFCVSIYWVSQKSVPNFDLLLTAIMLGILGFPVFPDLYNLFDSLLICFHHVMNKQQ